MRNGFRTIGVAAVVALSLTALAIQEGVILKRSPKAGDVEKYKLTSEMDMQGSPVTMNALIAEKVTSVSESGDYTIESKMEQATVNVNGSDMDITGQTGGPTTTVYKATGEVVSVKSDAGDTAYRMAHLQSLSFPATPLKVGDTWTSKVKKDDKGSVDATGTYKVEAQEKVGTHDTYKVHAMMKESIDQDPASTDTMAWIDIKDGKLIKLSGTWTNAPIPQLGPTTMKVTMTLQE